MQTSVSCSVEVTDVDLDERTVRLREVAGERAPEAIQYDTLVVSGGAQYNYFGHDRWRTTAPNLKTLEGALAVRQQILGAFEAARQTGSQSSEASGLAHVSWSSVPGQPGWRWQVRLPRSPTTFAAISGRSIPADASILLVEAGDRVLQEFPASLSARAERSLARLGVTIARSSTRSST